jgi:hypothetical protein
MAESSAEKKAQRALDILEIQNVMGLHEYFILSSTVEVDEWEAIWAHSVPDVSWEGNWGTWVGTEKVRDTYAKSKHRAELLKKDLEEKCKIYPDIQKVEYVGSFAIHALTTPIIEVAGDGKTAKGWWYSIGALTGHIDQWGAYWSWERYACDFIKENGKWKIWHFCVYTDFNTPYERDWVDNALHPRLPAERPIHGVETDLPGRFNPYSPTRVPQILPKAPEPYETFSETFSYGPTREQLAQLGIKVDY